MKRNHTKKLSIVNMVILTFTICALLPVLVTGVMFVRNVIYNSSEQQKKFLLQFDEQITNALDMISEEIQGLQFMHTTNWDMLRILRKDYVEHDAEYIADYRLMADLIDVCMQTNSKIYRMALISRSGEVFSQLSPPDIRADSETYARLDWFENSEREMMIFPPANLEKRYGEEGYIPYLLRLRDPHTGVTVGCLMVDMRYSMLEKLLDSVKENERLHVMIFSEGEFIYSSSAGDAEDAEFLKEIQEFLASGEGMRTVYRTENGYLEGAYTLSTRHHEVMGWDVVTYAPDGMMNGSFYNEVTDYLALMAAILLVGWLAARVLFRRFVRSVRVLSDAMLDARKGYLKEIDVAYPNTRELCLLYDSYNAMSEKILDSVQREYEMRILQKKTEMDMLLSQINPHFLYNTLNLLRAVVQIKEFDRADRIIMCLSAMLRYSSRKEDFVTIREEIEQMESYLTIQSLRFLDTIQTDIDVEQAILDCKVIKFILQPIVENAFKHGLELIKNNRRLSIRVRQKQKDIEVVVCDNGIGISPERLAMLRDALEEVTTGHFEGGNEKGTIGIGLLNVHKRICYTYGARYGLDLVSKQGSGTAVTIKIPMCKKDGDIYENPGG